MWMSEITNNPSRDYQESLVRASLSVDTNNIDEFHQILNRYPDIAHEEYMISWLANRGKLALLEELVDNYGANLWLIICTTAASNYDTVREYCEKYYRELPTQQQCKEYLEVIGSTTLLDVYLSNHFHIKCEQLMQQYECNNNDDTVL